MNIPMETGAGYVLEQWKRLVARSGNVFRRRTGCTMPRWIGTGMFGLHITRGASSTRTVGKIDGKTGEVTNVKIPADNGRAATTHGIVLAHDGTIWFTLNTTGSAISAAATAEETGEAPGKIGMIDPKTEKVEVFAPPKGMSGASISINEDGIGEYLVFDGPWRDSAESQDKTIHRICIADAARRQLRNGRRSRRQRMVDSNLH